MRSRRSHQVARGCSSKGTGEDAGDGVRGTGEDARDGCSPSAMEGCYALNRMREAVGLHHFWPVRAHRGRAVIVAAGSGRVPGEGRDWERRERSREKEV
jgi:hypothetical protein